MFPLQPVNFTGISARDLVVWRGERRVLDGLSVEATPGECVHVAGPNGSGKTTLLRVLAGFVHPERGTVMWGGKPIHKEADAYRGSFGFLGHSDGLKSELSARENLAYSAGLRRRFKADEIDKVLTDVGLESAAEQPAAQLSAGQRRRLAMARVELIAAPLWLLDEPFTNLDAAGIALVSALIVRHLAAGGTCLMAAHQPPLLPDRACRRLALA
jgi:heme exporter protein A